MSNLARVTVLAALIALTGCGRGDAPELADVTGKVTLDGSPLVGAEVGFFPKSGRPAFATTNDKGEYTLQYLDGMPGGPLGENAVQIRRSAASGEGVDPKSRPAELSEQYNDQTTLSANVKSGSNTFDFELKTMDRKDGKKGAVPVARP